MADVADSAAAPPAAPGHLTLPPPPPDKGPVGPPPPEPGEENDPFRFGWRYLRHTAPDGSETYEQVPLSWDDLLYPEEEDFVVQKPPHQRDYSYCHYALQALYRGDPSVVVLGDCRIDFGVAGLRPLGPDVVALFGVRQWLRQGTFEVAHEGGRPVLVIEVASPSTRPHDLSNKPDLYYRAGVGKYVIVDRGRRGESPPRLLGYQRGPRGWLDLPPDARGRLDLAPVGALIGLEGDEVWLYDARSGEHLPDITEAMQAKLDAEVKTRDAEAKARDEAQARADAEAQARDAEAQARDAEAKARDEARARADAEAKARDAEAKARDAEAKARDETRARADAEAKARDAEAKARDAEAKARDETRARTDAEAKARDEVERRAALEERLRELEEQLRRQQGHD